MIPRGSSGYKVAFVEEAMVVGHQPPCSQRELLVQEGRVTSRAQREQFPHHLNSAVANLIARSSAASLILQASQGFLQLPNNLFLNKH